MRKNQLIMVLEFVQTLHHANEQIKKMIDKREILQVMELLEEYQYGVIQLGNLIEASEGKDFILIHYLEDYCELIYQIHRELGETRIENGNEIYKRLYSQLMIVENSIKANIKIKLEVVFLPYKASMWDSLESVWMAADKDENCNAYVIPIPYYDKNKDGSFGDIHYEGDQYPDYVPITHYEQYDFSENCPDMIFIHNAYDSSNYVTSVPSFFFSKNLKQYTDNLIYIPYFVLDEIESDNQVAVDKIKHLCTIPGIVNADKVVVQSENIRKIYINIMTELTGGTNGIRVYWENKILGLGSPKVDKVLRMKREEISIPNEWFRIIQKPDGSRKKIVFYNTTINTLLEHGNQMLKKIKDVMNLFKEYQDEVAFLWRPHPLIKATIKSIKPQLLEEYEKLVQEYCKESWGIYDESADMYRAISLSDAYYGDISSILFLYKMTGKPIMIQDVDKSE